MYTKEQFAKMIDNTLLRPDATTDDVLRLCEESAQRHFASVCILPCWVGTAARALDGSDVKVCTVVGFPFGATTRLTKVYEIKNAIANGAREIDAVMNIAKFKSGDYEAVAAGPARDGATPASAGERRTRPRAASCSRSSSRPAILTDEEKEQASRLVRDCRRGLRQDLHRHRRRRRDRRRHPPHPPRRRPLRHRHQGLRRHQNRRDRPADARRRRQPHRHLLRHRPLRRLPAGGDDNITLG